MIREVFVALIVVVIFSLVAASIALLFICLVPQQPTDMLVPRQALSSVDNELKIFYQEYTRLPQTFYNYVRTLDKFPLLRATRELYKPEAWYAATQTLLLNK